jgi:transforming growth factor-beta-induced protein
MVSSPAIVTLVVALVGLSSVLQGCGSAGSGDATTTTTTAIGPNTIPGIAERTKDLSTLVTALQTAGLVDILAGKGPFTVFAPTNDAFAELPKAELTYLLHNKTALTEVLEYHVASGSVLSTALTNGEKIMTLEGENVTVTITKTSNGTTVKIDDATVKTANVKASNGVVHVIDKVLVPPGFSAPTIPQLATAANLSTLVAAVTAAKLVDTLSGAGPFTVFAPTNEAFAALSPGVLTALLKPENIKALTSILTYHVASGEVLSSDLTNGEQIKTLEGQDVNVTISGSDVSINAAKVTDPNVFAVNGVVHVIDAVLLPPGFVPPSMPVDMVIV